MQKILRQAMTIILEALLLTGLISCGIERPPGWGELSHGPDAAPDYEKLFDDSVVHRFDFTIDPDLCRAAQDDLADKLSGGGPGQPVSDEDPIFVPASMDFDGLTWWYVGMRYKGNSSLRSAYQRGILKLAFRLNFEMYENEHPEIQNQRFFGFEKMTFSNGFKDNSLIRDKLAADIFRSGGVPAARGAFARIYVDCGEGPVYFGMYTMIEDPSDKMLDIQFGDGSGNLYKPEENRGDSAGGGARWVSFVEDQFYKKTNLDSDWNDVVAAIDALHADRSNASAWRDGLEDAFNAPGFLGFLALNQAMVNWDSYGCMPHNYFLYGDPSDGGRLTWFPWDLNEALLEEGLCHADSVLLDEIDSDWPLIRFLLDDPHYRQIYQDELEAAIEGAFNIDAVFDKLEAYHELIAPYVLGPEAQESAPYTLLGSAEEFENSIDGDLKPHVEARHAAVQQALGL